MTAHPADVVRLLCTMAVVAVLALGPWLHSSAHAPHAGLAIPVAAAEMELGQTHDWPAPPLRAAHGHGPDALDHDHVVAMLPHHPGSRYQRFGAAAWRAMPAPDPAEPVFDLDRPPRG